MIKVSIITSCYNREATIRHAIESVLSQDYPHIEYIIVDGASKDNSLGVINEYRDKISVIISEPDKGMYEAINKGIRASTGDVVGLLHSDDFLYSTSTISDVIRHIESQQADILYGNGLFVDCHTTTKVVRNWISGAYKRSKMRRGWLPLHTTLYIRRECFDRFGLYDESYKISADSDFLVRYMYNTPFKITYYDNYVVVMRMGGLSTDPKRMAQKFREDMLLYATHGFSQLWAIGGKLLSKVPQFITAKFTKTELTESKN